MKCYSCDSKMKCVDDIVTDWLRMDFFKCKRCHSKASVTYGKKGEYVLKVEWEK